MYKPLVLLVLFSFILNVSLSCEQTCYATSSQYGKCYFQCEELCGRSAALHRNMFLKFLNSKNFECKPFDDADSIVCNNPNNIMERCGKHIWYCGRDCNEQRLQNK